MSCITLTKRAQCLGRWGLSPSFSRLLRRGFSFVESKRNKEGFFSASGGNWGLGCDLGLSSSGQFQEGASQLGHSSLVKSCRCAKRFLDVVLLGRQEDKKMLGTRKGNEQKNSRDTVIDLLHLIFQWLSWGFCLGLIWNSLPSLNDTEVLDNVNKQGVFFHPLPAQWSWSSVLLIVFLLFLAPLLQMLFWLWACQHSSRSLLTCHLSSSQLSSRSPDPVQIRFNSTVGGGGKHCRHCWLICKKRQTSKH